MLLVQQELSQQEQLQVQQPVLESAWMWTDPELVQEQQQELVQELVLLLFSCSQLRMQEPGTGKVRAKSSFSFDTTSFLLFIDHC